MNGNDTITTTRIRLSRDPWNQGEREAADNGNPYPWNTPSWHVWNEGHRAAVSKLARGLAKRIR